MPKYFSWPATNIPGIGGARKGWLPRRFLQSAQGNFVLSEVRWSEGENFLRLAMEAGRNPGKPVPKELLPRLEPICLSCKKDVVQIIFESIVLIFKAKNRYFSAGSDL